MRNVSLPGLTAILSRPTPGPPSARHGCPNASRGRRDRCRQVPTPAPFSVLFNHQPERGLAHPAITKPGPNAIRSGFWHIDLELGEGVHLGPIRRRRDGGGQEVAQCAVFQQTGLVSKMIVGESVLARSAGIQTVAAETHCASPIVSIRKGGENWLVTCGCPCGCGKLGGGSCPSCVTAAGSSPSGYPSGTSLQ